MQPRAFAVLLLASAPGLSQVGSGTLLQSISTTQLAGVTSVALPGNPSITTNEILAWSQGEANGRMRALWNAQALGLLLGDRNGDGLPFDLPDIDAIALAPPSPGALAPSPYDLRLSFATDLASTTGPPITSGDVIRFTGQGTTTTVVSRAQLQAALGTSAALNVDGYAEVSDGSILVSFALPTGTSGLSGNNIVNPLTGGPGQNITFTGADVFAIRPPFGALPAVFVYRQSDLAAVVNAPNNYGSGYTLTEVRDIEVQPGVSFIDNPAYDPLNVYAGGLRPRLLWICGNDDNVFCYGNAQYPAINPLSSAHNIYALVGNGATSMAGYSTNLSTQRVFADGLAIWPAPMGPNTRSTLDVSNHLPASGGTLQLFVRSPEPAGSLFGLVMSLTTLPGQGLLAGNGGFRHLLLDPSDPLLLFSLDPVIAPLLTTGPANAQGTATSLVLPIPAGLAGTPIFWQGYELTPPFALTAPTFIRIS
jgi:hypothetical protein